MGIDTRFNADLTRAEAKVLYEELGDIKKSLLGPKLLAFYARLESYLELTAPPPPRKKRSSKTSETEV